MATRSIVPRADGEGSVGTSAKAWGGVWAKKFNGADPNLFYLVRQNSTAYIVGDIAFSPSLPSAMFLKCIEAGTTAATEPSFSGAAVGGTVTDGTVVWQYYDLLSGSGVPLGTILPYSGTGDTPPYGFLYAEGQAVSRTMYADYFALVGTKYGAGDGETTFNLPNPLNRYVEFAQTAGTVKAAGLPNITGSFTTDNYVMRPYFDGTSTGALDNPSTVLQNRAYGTSSTGSTNHISLTFDASKSNPIYGNSDTVTPPTITFRAIVKVYDAPTPSSAQIDLSQYASDLARRLTREQTPAFNKRDVITTSGTYVAPVTGWYKITVKGGGGGGAGGTTVSGSTVSRSGGGGGEGGTSIAYEKMTAGQTASVVIGAGGTGGAANANGTQGGDSTVTVNNNTYTGGGGSGGSVSANAGVGGSGNIQGNSGGSGGRSPNGNALEGGTGGGAGGSIYGTIASQGGGGAGGGVGSNNTGYAGGAGGSGYAWFELFDPTLM